MARGGAAVVVPDSELEPVRLRAVAGELLDDPPRLERMTAASRRLARPDAAKQIAAVVLDAATSGTRDDE
jgi:UDP-N-acetylglucosamine--N-acetylmuramyl-(pentapeptide) pyrophosphoryl-undecaprenol N-acetylglucosamine transferase